MTEHKGFIQELLSRRIPQIIGVYIAALWLAVEMGDWMSEKFAISSQLTSYVFIAGLTLLPAVIILAWGHGKPGKDKWSKFELISIPVNIVVAVLAINLIVQPVSPAIQKLSIIDEKHGQTIEYEVAKADYYQPVLAFFWENKSSDLSLDWLSYASPWMLAQDLRRSPVISVTTPFDSRLLLNQIRTKGFDEAIAEPLALDLQLAKRRSARWVVRGSINKTESGTQFSAKLYDIQSSDAVKTVVSEHSDWMVALNDISDQLSKTILMGIDIKQKLIPELGFKDYLTDDTEAVKSLILAKKSISFENDYQQAIEHALAALELDDTFAEASVSLVQYYLLSGELTQAILQAQKALKLDYKLHPESVFLLKANYYTALRDNKKAIMVLENWVTIYPKSVNALNILGQTYVMAGKDLDRAQVIYEKLMDLEGGDSKALLNLGQIYRLKDQQEKAITTIKHYLEIHPEKGSAYLNLAKTYRQFGLYDQARQMFEQASIFENSEVEAKMGLINLIANQGQDIQAIEELKQLLASTKSNNDRFLISASIEVIYAQTGRINKANEVAQASIQYQDATLPPLLNAMSNHMKSLAYMTSLGEFEAAFEFVESIKDEYKPPMDVLLHVFESGINLAQEDYESYEENMSIYEDFVSSIGSVTADQSVLYSKGKIAYEKGDYPEALELLNDAIKQGKKSFLVLETPLIINEAIYDKSQALLALDRANEALDAIELVLKNNPLDGKAMILQAHIYLSLGELEKARGLLQRVQHLWRDVDEGFIYSQRMLDLEQLINDTPIN